MLPHVATQKRGLAEAQGVHAVLGLGHLERSVLVLDEPAPAGAELARTRGRELFLELVDRAEGLLDRLFQFARHLVALRAHHLPELHVVPVLRGVVEDAVLRHRPGLVVAGDDRLERLALPLRPGDQLVAVVDIGLVVQVMVVLERFLRHAERGERIVGIGKIGKGEGHGLLLSRVCSLTRLRPFGFRRSRGGRQGLRGGQTSETRVAR